MSNDATGATAAPTTPAAPAPSAPAQPPAAPAAPPAAPPPPAAGEGAPIAITSKALADRLQETREAAERRILRELGAETLADAKKKLAAQAGAETPEQVAARAERGDRLLEYFRIDLERQLSELPEQARKAIVAASDDPEDRLALVQTFHAAGVLPKAPATAPAAPAAPPQADPAAPAPPAATAPPPNAPSGNATGTTDHKAIHAQLKRDNPIAAAAYLRLHGNSIYPERRGG